MIFIDYASTDFDIKLGAKNKDSESDRLKYIEYENGSFDVVDFGTRSVDEASFSVDAIIATEYDALLSYLLENVGREINVTDSSDIFGFGISTAETFKVFIEDATPKGEREFTKVGFFSIALKVNRKVDSVVKREFLLDVDLNAFSVDTQVPTFGDLPKDEIIENYLIGDGVDSYVERSNPQITNFISFETKIKLDSSWNDYGAIFTYANGEGNPNPNRPAFTAYILPDRHFRIQCYDSNPYDNTNGRKFIKSVELAPLDTEIEIFCYLDLSTPTNSIHFFVDGVEITALTSDNDSFSNMYSLSSHRILLGGSFGNFTADTYESFFNGEIHPMKWSTNPLAITPSLMQIHFTGKENFTQVAPDALASAWFGGAVQGETIIESGLVPEGETALVENPRKLYTFTSPDWVEQFPLKPYEVTYYINVLESITIRPKVGQTAFETSTKLYYIYDEILGWDLTAYPELSPWKAVVNNDPSIGLKNGVLSWSAFADGNYNGIDYLSGFIAEKGITFPTKSVSIEKGFGLETLDGFSVRLNNAERFSLTNVEFNFFGAVCTLWVLIDGVFVKERTAQNKTNNFDSGFFELKTEPFLWLDQDKNVNQGSFSTENSNGKQTPPSLYGIWNYAPLILKNESFGFQKTSKNIDTFLITIVGDWSALNDTQDITIPIPEEGFTFKSIDSETPTWYVTLSVGSRAYTVLSQTVDTTIDPFASPFGTITLTLSTSAQIDGLIPSTTMRAFDFEIVYITTQEESSGFYEPLEIYSYDEEADVYTELPSGTFEVVDNHTVKFVNDPTVITVDGDNIFTRHYLKNFRVKLTPNEGTENYGFVDFVNKAPFVNGSPTVPLSIEKQVDLTTENFYQLKRTKQSHNQESIVVSDFGDLDETINKLEAYAACFVYNPLHKRSIVFGEKPKETINPSSTISLSDVKGLAFEALADSWWNRSSKNGAGIYATTKTPLGEHGQERLNPKFQFNESPVNNIVPQDNMTKTLGASFSWGLTPEMFEKMRGQKEVRWLTQFAIYGFSQDNSLTNRGRVGAPLKNPDSVFGGTSPRLGHYLNVTCELWLRGGESVGGDRMVLDAPLEFLVSSNQKTEGNTFNNDGDTTDQFNLPANVMFNRFCGSHDHNRGDQTRQVHQFCNIPKSLGGSDEFYNSEDTEYQSTDFWVSFFVFSDTLTASTMIGSTISNTGTGISGIITDATIIAVDGKSYTSGSEIPEILTHDDGSKIYYAYMYLKVDSDADDLDQWVNSEANRNSWVFSATTTELDTKETLNDGYPEYAYAGRDLFKFSDAVVEELFSSEDYKLPNYDRLEAVCYLWRDSNGHPTGQKFIQMGAYQSNVLSMEGSTENDYDTFDGNGYFEFNSDIDPKETYYVKAKGQIDLDDKLIVNPREIAQDKIRNVLPDFNILFSSSYADRERWVSRSLLQGDETIKKVLTDLTKDTNSVITYTDDGQLQLHSASLTDYIGFVKFGFDESSISKKSKNKVKFRDITEIFTDFKFNFNYNAGKGETDKNLRVKLASNGVDLIIEGLEPANGDSEQLIELKASEKQRLIGIIGEDFRVSSTFYNTGKFNKYEGNHNIYYDNNLAYENSNGDNQYGISSMVSLASKWIRGNILNSWELEFETKMDYVLFDSLVEGDRLTLADPISFKLSSITGEFILYGLIKKIKPDYYNGTVKITIYSSVDPFTYATLYDRIWDGGDVDNIDYDKDNFVLKPLFQYPFKSGSGDFTYPDGGDTDSVSYDKDDNQFTDDSFADPSDEYKPF